MNFGTDHDTDDVSFELNLTPFIDVLFTLLLFFMVSTSFSKPQVLDVQLPKAGSGVALNEERTLVLTIRRNGELSFDGESVTMSDVDERFRAIAQVTTQPLLVVRADRETEHGIVVEVMDSARRHGINKLAIATVEKR